MNPLDLLRRFTSISAGDLFTLANGTLGLLALIYILDDTYTGYGVAVGLLLLALVADGLDGAVARRFGSKHHYGIYLDSIADTVSFCLAPAALIYMLFYDPGRGPALGLFNGELGLDPRFDLYNFMAVVAALLVGVLGMLRLARFTMKQENVQPYFSGLPTPAMTLLVLPMVLLWSPSSRVHAQTSLAGVEYQVGPVSLLITLSLAAAALLMVSELPYPKLQGRFMLAGLVSLGLAGLGVLLHLIESNLVEVVWAVVFSLQMAYLIGGPLVTRRYLNRLGPPDPT